MNKSKSSLFAWIVFIVFAALCAVSIGCERMCSFLYSSDKTLAKQFYAVGSAVVPWTILIYPLVVGIPYTIVSLIGMIKNKTLQPYLLITILSVVLWIAALITNSMYM